MIALEDRHVVEGFKLPTAGSVTDNDGAWVEFLRIIYNDDVPAPSFDQIVQLRRIERGPERAEE